MLFVDECFALVGWQVQAGLSLALLHPVNIQSHDRQWRVGVVWFWRLISRDARNDAERSSMLLHAINDKAKQLTQGAPTEKLASGHGTAVFIHRRHHHW